MKNNTVLKIVKEIESIRKEHPQDCYDSGGRELLISKVNDYVSKNRTLILVLPSFPFKSQNRDNTLGNLPDMGEYIALEVLNSLCNNIRKIYKPGVDFVLASDGRLYSDLVGVSDSAVNSYREELLKMNNAICKDSCLRWFSLDEGIKHEGGLDVREILERDYSDGIKVVMEEVKKDKDYLRLYIGFKNFALSEIKAQNLNCSNREMIRRAKGIAKKMMVRNFANAKLLKVSFPDMIRLSVKHHDTRRGLFAVNLMRTHTDIGTPWLNSILRLRNGKYKYIKVREARAQGYKEIMKEGRGYMFAE
jgi:pyoverdine/dityrosine biosynthesis protein Dit1